MAPDRFLSLDRLLQTETVTAGAAGTDITIGERKVIGISVDGKCFIKFSTDGTNAAATDTLLPAAGIYTFHTAHWTKLSIFAHSGGNVITSVFECSNV